MQMIHELLAWWTGLSPAAAFFYAIPFMVAAAGLLAAALRRERG